MKKASRQKRPEDSSFGDKLLRSAQQARDWVQGKPVRVRVTYVPAPQVDVRKLRAKMGLSQTQFAAKFGFSLDSISKLGTGSPAAGRARAYPPCRHCKEPQGGRGGPSFIMKVASVRH